jgi:hypothetical protein
MPSSRAQRGLNTKRIGAGWSGKDIFYHESGHRRPQPMNEKQNTTQPLPQLDDWRPPPDLPPLRNEENQTQVDGDCATLLLIGKARHEAAKGPVQS